MTAIARVRATQTYEKYLYNCPYPGLLSLSSYEDDLFFFQKHLIHVDLHAIIIFPFDKAVAIVIFIQKRVLFETRKLFS